MPTIFQASLTSDEIKVIRFLEKQFLAIGGEPAHMQAPVTTAEQVKTECGLDESSYRRVITRFEVLGCAKAIMPGAIREWVNISPVVVDLVHQFDHPPTKDYWADLKKWAFSKWWFVPVMLLGVALPWATGIILGAQLLIKWFGAGN